MIDARHVTLNLPTLRLLLIASTNFCVFALRVLAYTNFSDFLCLHNVIMSAKPSAEFICRHWMQALHHALSHILTASAKDLRTYGIYTILYYACAYECLAPE